MAWGGGVDCGTGKKASEITQLLLLIIIRISVTIIKLWLGSVLEFRVRVWLGLGLLFIKNRFDHSKESDI